MGLAFVDACIFIAFGNSRDRKHDRAENLMDRLRRGEFAHPITSDYVFDEAVTTALIGTGRPDFAINLGKMIIGSREESIPPLVRMIRVSDRVFAEAWTSFKAGRYPRLSFTDHTILVQMKESGADLLISFDSRFDWLVSRIG